MGYTTDFSGEFKLDKPLSAPQAAFLKKFNETRRMKRDAEIAETLPDPVREAAGLPIGFDGGYFVGAPGLFGQDRDASVIDYNRPAEGQPSLWCQWTPNETGTAIEWDGGEKFYSYVEWLEYIIGHFLKPWGLSLTGKVSWQGEEPGDRGIIHVRENVVTNSTSRQIRQVYF